MTGRSITRRGALAGTAGTVAAAGLTGSALANVVADRRLIALEHCLGEAKATRDAAGDAWERAHDLAEAMYPPVPAPLADYVRTYKFGSHAWCEEMREVGRADLIDMGREYGDECSEVDRQYSVGDLADVWEEAARVVFEIEEAIATTSAQTLRGAAIKLRVICDPETGIETGERDTDAPALRNVLAVIERLGGTS